MADDGWEQRAFVTGYCDREMAVQIALACHDAGLKAIVVAPDYRPRRKTNFDVSIPVTTDDGEAFTWVGAAESIRDIRSIWAGALSAAGLNALLGSHSLTVYDPEWGRKDLLWNTLLEAIR